MELKNLVKNPLAGVGEREKTEFSIIGFIGCVGAAIILDVASIFPILNIITGFINWIIFGALFWYKGVSRQQVYGLRNLLLRITEFIPLGSILTLITVSVIIIIKNHNKEVYAEIAAKNEQIAKEQEEAEESAVMEAMG